jgi:hypothetical protein
MVIVPAANLGAITVANFEADWQPVAYIDGPQNYKDATDPDGMKFVVFRGTTVDGKKIARNLIELKKIGANWRWRVTYLADDDDPLGSTPEMPATRTEHLDFPMVSAARWRWIPGDEGIWTRCANGCCQLTAF